MVTRAPSELADPSTWTTPASKVMPASKSLDSRFSIESGRLRKRRIDRERLVDMREPFLGGIQRIEEGFSPPRKNERNTNRPSAKKSRKNSVASTGLSAGVIALNLGRWADLRVESRGQVACAAPVSRVNWAK